MKNIHSVRGEVIGGIPVYWAEADTCRCPYCNGWISKSLDPIMALALTPGENVASFVCPHCKVTVQVEITVEVSYKLKVFIDRRELP